MVCAFRQGKGKMIGLTSTNVQVFTITTSASRGCRTILNPFFCKSPNITSASTVFFGHPSATSATLFATPFGAAPVATACRDFKAQLGRRCRRSGSRGEICRSSGAVERSDTKGFARCANAAGECEDADAPWARARTAISRWCNIALSNLKIIFLLAYCALRPARLWPHIK